jgi:hypothetical protein
MACGAWRNVAPLDLSKCRRQKKRHLSGSTGVAGLRHSACTLIHEIQRAKKGNVSMKVRDLMTKRPACCGADRKSGCRSQAEMPGAPSSKPYNEVAAAQQFSKQAFIERSLIIWQKSQ